MIFRRLRNSLKTLINTKYNQYILNSSENISTNPKRFWGLVRSRCKNKTLPVELNHEDSIATSSQEKANLFNLFFSTNFSAAVHEQPPDSNTFINPDLADVRLEVAEVRLLLTTMNANKASGPDNLPGTLLKECAAELAPSLTLLFNLSLSSGHIPNLWKTANVTPVFKKGDKHSCKNYRPISLLCIVSKILERAVLNKIYDHFSHLITSSQHGFLRGKSTCTQLLSVFHDINSSLDSGTQTDVIYLDFSKAFDSVPHSLLCSKLKHFGFSGHLHAWFTSYLKNRKQRVSIEGVSSDWLPVTSGVPQGSILGPILFILYTNDIGDHLSQGTTIALYADDTKVFRPIHSIQDCRMLQSDLCRLQTWSCTWKLAFNTAKCQVISFGRKINFAFNYRLNNDLLVYASDFNDLGVTVSNTLSWNAHIRKIVSKSNRLLGLIKRTLGFRAPIKAKLLLYKSLIRSTLMYASVIWYPDRASFKLLEGVQRRATKYILNDYVSDYKTRLKNIGLLPLSYFRELNDICFFYKCTYGFCNLNLSSLAPFCDSSNERTRSGRDGLRLQVPYLRTETARRFYSFRIVNLWNNLPENIKSTICLNNNISPLKHKLNQYYLNKMSTSFDPNNVCTWVSHCGCAACRPT